MKCSTSLRIGSAAVVLLAVASCSGSTSSPVETTTPDSESYTAAAGAISQLKQMAAGMEETTIAAMPSAGRGDYVGGLSVAHTDGTRMNGQVVLRADFEQGLVDGHLTNFADAKRGSIQGSLDMWGAQITGNQLTGRFDGELQGNDGLAPASAELWGNFRGEGADYLSGQIVLTHGSRAFDGDFITGLADPIRLD